MREFKFKAYDSKNKIMTICRNLTDWFNTYAQFEYDTKSNQIERIEQFIFLQYTGLKDKNGKEIYEGDLLHNEELLICPFKVIYDEGFGAFITDDGSEFLSNAISKYGLKVIGNIYENPELTYTYH